MIRVPTDTGNVWFKANSDSLLHEAALATRIAARRPDAQLDLTGDVDALLELGVPDMRLSVLPDKYDALMDVTPYRDAYLESFAGVYAGDLAALCTPALRLGWACRAVNGHVPGDDKQTFTRLRMFLDGTP